MIPREVILDCCCVLMGANAGTLLRNKIPAKLQEPLMVIFGMCAIASGAFGADFGNYYRRTD